MSFRNFCCVSGIEATKSAAAVESERLCNAPRAKMRVFVTFANGFLRRQGESIHSAKVGADARMAQASNMLRMTSGSCVGGCARDGSILRRTISMGVPQQVQQLRPQCECSGRAGRQLEHQQLQQRNHSFAIGMQKAKVARAPKALGQQVLPSGVKRFRHYRVLASSCKGVRLAAARAALQKPVPNPQAMESAQAFLARVAKMDAGMCLCCKMGRLKLVASLAGLPYLPSPGSSGLEVCREPP